ncbi:hypothetical protein EXE43_14825 [Halorubrum sp. SS5]|nr:hypothetical protein EXE43_14825 [Halorubrum sp. SS5]
MSGDIVEIPVEVEVTPVQHGTLRTVKVVSPEDIHPELDTQEWRLKEISVETHVRDKIDIRGINKTTNVGVVWVDPGTLNWKFIED